MTPHLRLIAPPDKPAQLRDGLIVGPAGPGLRTETARRVAWAALHRHRCDQRRALASLPHGDDAA